MFRLTAHNLASPQKPQYLLCQDLEQECKKKKISLAAVESVQSSMWIFAIV